MDEKKGATTAQAPKIAVTTGSKAHTIMDADRTAGALGSAYYSCGS
jgi:hypothetical protein